MQCNCGGMTVDTRHTVKTITTAKEWDETLTEDDLPIVVEQVRCSACGRALKPRIRKQADTRTG